MVWNPKDDPPTDWGDYAPPAYEPWTPIKCEQVMHDLIYMIARAEIEARKAMDHENECSKAWERAHVIASMDPECPRVGEVMSTENGTVKVTVAYRDDWIRGCELDEYEALQDARRQVERIKRYQNRLGDQASLVQSMSKQVLAAYSSNQGAGAR